MCVPIILLCLADIFIVNPEEGDRPEFIKYEYLRIRKKVIKLLNIINIINTKGLKQPTSKKEAYLKFLLIPLHLQGRNPKN